jgi:transcriptional regulator with XRE-family HTH domain
MQAMRLQELARRANVESMATPKDLPRDIGGFIRDLRHNARISLRQLAEQTGVSNPYLSQIERGLRKPSAEVLQQLASALRVSTPAMYLRAGLLDSDGQPGVLSAIAVDPDLTMAQKQSLSQIYETFRGESQRHAAAAQAEAAQTEAAQTEAAQTEAAQTAPEAVGVEAAPAEPTPVVPADEASRQLAAVVDSVAAVDAPTTTPKPAKKAARRAATKAAPAVQEETS